MKVKINSSSKQILDTDNIDYVQLPGASGQMGILPGHEPLITTLDVGEVVIRSKSEEKVLVLNGGFAQIAKDEIFILADDAALAENIVEHEISEAIRRAEEKLVGKLEPSELIQLEKILRYEKLKQKLVSGR